jgi:hypothetical protein
MNAAQWVGCSATGWCNAATNPERPLSSESSICLPVCLSVCPSFCPSTHPDVAKKRASFAASKSQEQGLSMLDAYHNDAASQSVCLSVSVLSLTCRRREPLDLPIPFHVPEVGVARVEQRGAKPQPVPEAVPLRGRHDGLTQVTGRLGLGFRVYHGTRPRRMLEAVPLWGKI